MKIFITTLTFIVIAFASFDSQAQSQQPSNLELKNVSGSDSNSPSIEIVPSGESGSMQGSDIRVIDGRKVRVDSQGVQSLAVPEGIPLTNDEIKKPD